MSKILISGGTGFIGQAITNALLKKGAFVRILTRDSSKISKIFGSANVEGIEGDITKPASLSKALEGIDIVIQCAQFPGHPVENPRRGYTYWQVDALGTENLAKAAKQAEVKHLIYISGAGTNEFRTEPWFRAKWHAEQAIRSSGITSTILRPSWVYGPGDKSLNKIIKMIKKFPLFPLFGSGNNHIQPIFVENLAEIVSLCVDYQKKDCVFDVGGPEEMTNKEMMKRVAKILGRKVLFVPIPKLLIKMGTFPLKFLPKPPLTPQTVNFLTMDVKIDIAPLKKAFPQLRLKTIEEGGAYVNR
ncbi:MAG: hypothetical protein A3H42_03850 [Deltaproteobacteria bacterium RIFCSPLOWO2_02_FULL_46_8]|nr:MAG: hypothetical protein A3H42_03850 [Deltaproteobacteria bacterium RIFCSPLOWO2_02_FULL_46_8]